MQSAWLGAQSTGRKDVGFIVGLISAQSLANSVALSNLPARLRSLGYKTGTAVCPMQASAPQGSLSSYLAAKGVFLSQDHVAHQVTEVYPIWKIVWPRVVKGWVLVQLRQKIFIGCFLKTKTGHENGVPHFDSLKQHSIFSFLSWRQY